MALWLLKKSNQKLANKFMKKKLYQHKNIKPWSEATDKQIKSTHVSRYVSPVKSVVAYVPETNSEILCSILDDGNFHVRMLRKVGRDIFYDDRFFSRHGAIGLMDALNTLINYSDDETRAQD